MTWKRWLYRKKREAIRKDYQLNTLSYDVATVAQGWYLKLTVYALITVPVTLRSAFFNLQHIWTECLFSVLGTVGFFACFFYVRRIYSNISVPEKPVTTWMVEHCWSHNFPLGLFQSCSTTVGCESLEPNFGESLALGCYTWILTFWSQWWPEVTLLEQKNSVIVLKSIRDILVCHLFSYVTTKFCILSNLLLRPRKRPSLLSDQFLKITNVSNLEHLVSDYLS